ncbi:MAG: alanyl-tRNA editing protein [Candidatus Thermoplasmatota archaeon]
MVEALYMDDSYLKEWNAKIESVSKGKFVVLDKTAFFPRGGGVKWDTGTITNDSEEFRVVYTGKFSGKISHEVDKEGLKKGDNVRCKLDWDRRYLLMRYHTATHVLSGVFFKDYNLKVTGNQLTTEKGRIDLNMDDLDVDLIKNAIEKSNRIIERDLPVEIYYKSREEAKKDPDLFELAIGFPHDIKTIRIVDIKGFDRQADGGCHVKDLDEIGKIIFKDAVNKGKNNKRVYFTLK